ncbi:DUF58 domain-containing protein [Belliella marina]|uniref:DUF58 domain-containing protein n=1 Tax=Belliella marina TaxID=1644146 RepID=A0ABW4VNN8_9BACT
MQFLRQLFFERRLYWILAGIAFIFLVSYWVGFLYPLGFISLWGLALLVIADFVFLFRRKNGIAAERVLPDKFSNSDFNTVKIVLKNNYSRTINAFILDEIPVQFQKRDFGILQGVENNGEKIINYQLLPKTRGEYYFGDLHIFVTSMLGLVKRRYSFQKGQMVKVYPSFIQMQQYDFLAANTRKFDLGLKKIRRIGHTMEFEQIKEYVQGDDIRRVNWKATAKSASLMMNQYQDEKSQPIYSIIDTGRVMQMPFDGLSLLDYAVNSTLAFSNIAIKKGDKAGLITFSNTIQRSLPAINRKTHLMSIMEMLYNVNTKFLDTDFGLLYNWLKQKVNHRSMLILFTNFEHHSALERQLVYLKAIAKKHLLVVVMFENTLLEELTSQPAGKLSDVFNKTVAEKFLYDKKLMAKELNRHGIQTILTKPSELSINTINKYLEIKARGLL